MQEERYRRSRSGAVEAKWQGAASREGEASPNGPAGTGTPDPKLGREDNSNTPVVSKEGAKSWLPPGVAFSLSEGVGSRRSLRCSRRINCVGGNVVDKRDRRTVEIPPLLIVRRFFASRRKN